MELKCHEQMINGQMRTAKYRHTCDTVKYFGIRPHKKCLIEIIPGMIYFDSNIGDNGSILKTFKFCRECAKMELSTAIEMTSSERDAYRITGASSESVLLMKAPERDAFLLNAYAVDTMDFEYDTNCGNESYTKIFQKPDGTLWAIDCMNGFFCEVVPKPRDQKKEDYIYKIYKVKKIERKITKIEVYYERIP